MGSDRVTCPACGASIQDPFDWEHLVDDGDRDEFHRCDSCHANVIITKHVTVDYEVRLAEAEKGERRPLPQGVDRG